jgi:hypothetical protein
MRIIRRCFFDKRRPVGHIGKRLKYCFNLKRRNRRKLLVRYYPGNKNIMQAVAGVVKTGVSVCNNVSMQISNYKLNKDVIENKIENIHFKIEEDHRYINIGSYETTTDKDLNYTNKINIVITSQPVTLIKVKEIDITNNVPYYGKGLLISTTPINEKMHNWSVINLNNKYITNRIKNESTYEPLNLEQIEYVQAQKSLLANKSEMLKENEIIRNPADDRYYVVSKENIIYEKNVIIYINFKNAKLLSAKWLTKFTFDVTNDVQITNKYKNEIKPEEYAKIKQDYEYFNQD